MKAVTAFLLVLCYLAFSDAWRCNEGPRLYNAMQIDAGQGKVVARDSSYYTYFLLGTSWVRMSTLRFKHVSVGPAGLWAANTANRVYKYVAGQFRLSSGLYMQQVDAGGDDQLVGISNSYHTYCLRSTIASAYTGVGSLSWTYLSRTMRYYSCGPLYGCWGVDSSYRVYVTKTITPSTCSTSGWTYVPTLKMKVIEVGSDGNVFGVDLSGKVYQRLGISSSRRQGTGWSLVQTCSSIRHVSYDLRNLWLVTTSGLVMKCTH